MSNWKRIIYAIVALICVIIATIEKNEIYFVCSLLATIISELANISDKISKK